MADVETGIPEIVARLKRETGVPGYDYTWFADELYHLSEFITATGEGIHAVVVATHVNGGTAYLDFSPCDEACGAHGLPLDPAVKRLPCITFW